MMALASSRSQYLDGGYGMDCAQDTAAAMDEAVQRHPGPVLRRTRSGSS